MGDIFVSDVGVARQLFKIDGSGNVTAVAGDGSISSGISGPALNVGIGACFHIDTDGSAIYLVDLINNNLLKYDQSTTPDSIFFLYSSPPGMVISVIEINGTTAYLGGTNGIIEFDLTTLTDQIITTEVSPAFMSYNQSDGLLYLANGNQLTSVNPNTGQADTLWTEPVGFIQGLHANGAGNNLVIDYCTALFGSPINYIKQYRVQPLPVELTIFTGENTEKGNLLFWQTVSEQNNSHFEIERSGNGRTWTVEEIIRGQGDSELLFNYEFLDINPLEGISYYRLKQVDFNGHFEYSKTISVTNEEDNDITIFPNPVKDILFWNSNNKNTNDPFEVEVYSLKGELIMKSLNNKNTLDVGILKNGVYLLIVKDHDSTIIRKFVKN